MDDTLIAAPTPGRAAEETIAATQVGEGAQLTPLRSRGPIALPDRIDRYLVLERLGAGGMGVVFAAYDPDLDRKLALKLLHDEGGGDTRSSRTRLRLLREAQALARVSHPNVIHVYDVGTVGERVYIAMEYVEGVTLGEWLDAEPRSLREITRVFAEAGRGLEAAHARELVHRDFKPDNVLVTREGHALVLDFGIAHAASKTDTDERPPPRLEGEVSSSLSAFETKLTRAGALIGTPAYMAPEQFEGGQTDARTDQFSFCVALWEAIHAQRPYPGESPLAIWQALRESELAAPSSRRVPRWIQSALTRGLSTNPAQRFESMAPLLAELERDRKAARRRWIAAGLVVASVGFGAYGVLDAREASVRLCTGASEQMDEVWNDARRSALSQAFLDSGVPLAERALPVVFDRVDTYAREWAAMYTDSCAATHLRGEQSAALLDLRTACLQERRRELDSRLAVFVELDATVIENSYEVVAGLRPLAACADVEALQAEVPLPEDPERAALVEQLRAELVRAQARSDAGDPERASHIAREVADRAATIGYEPVIAAAAIQLGRAHLNAGRFDDALGHLSDGFYLGLAVDQGAALDAAIALTELTGAHLQRYDEGLGWARSAEALLDRRGDGASPARVELELAKGTIQWRRGDRELAHEHLERTLERALALGPEHERLAWEARSNLGSVLWTLGEAEAAADTFRSLVEHQQQALGAEHPAVAGGLNNLGSAHYSLGRFEEARDELERAVTLYEGTYGPTHPEVGRSLNNLAVVYSSLEEHELARDTHRKVIRIHEHNLDEGHPEFATSWSNLAWTLGNLDEFEEALELFQRAHTSNLASRGPEHGSTLNSLEGLGWALIGVGRVEAGLAKLTEAVEERERVFGVDHAQTIEVIHRLAWEQAKLDRLDAAERGLRRALQLRERVLPSDHKDLAISVANLGHVLVELERFDEAVLLLERFRAMEASGHVSRSVRARARLDLAEALVARDETERAKDIAREGLDELQDAEAPKLRRGLQALVGGAP